MISGIVRATTLGGLVMATACSGTAQPGGSAGQLATQQVTGTGTASAAPTTPATAKPAAAVPAASASPSAPGQLAATLAPSAGVAVGKWNFDADPVGGVPAGAQVFSGQW